jgi:hypothetical protein
VDPDPDADPEPDAEPEPDADPEADADPEPASPFESGSQPRLAPVPGAPSDDGLDLLEPGGGSVWPDHVSPPPSWTGSPPAAVVASPQAGNSTPAVGLEHPGSDGSQAGEGPAPDRGALLVAAPASGAELEAPAEQPRGSAPGGAPGLAAGSSEGPEAPAAATSTEISGGPRRRPSRRIIVGALVIVLAVVAVVVVGRQGSKSPGGPAVIHPFVHTSTTIGGTGGPPILAHAAGTSFVLTGARFEVYLAGRQPWTAFAAKVSPGPRKRWVLVDVEVQNLTRKGFDPRVLHYRLLGAGGATFFPRPSYGTGPDVNRPPRPLGVGGRTEVELAFGVLNAATRLELAFDPTGQHKRVVVALG